MTDVLIENPVLNSPYLEPTRHFVFDEDGITDEIAESRRSMIKSSRSLRVPWARWSSTARSGERA